MVPGWGINVATGKAQGSTTASNKLSDLIQATGEYSVEAWVAPANVDPGGSGAHRQLFGRHDRPQLHPGPDPIQLRFPRSQQRNGQNGDPAFSTADGDEVLQATLQHVVDDLRSRSTAAAST